jgi:perosamine synthetase
MLKLASHRRIGALRRRHYQALHAACAGLPAIRPLFPGLPDGVYPWVFPLLADEPAQLARLCAALGRAGVPYVRFGETLWPGVDAGTCPVRADLSQRLVALPCHQALTAAELDWMAGQLRAAAA